MDPVGCLLWIRGSVGCVFYAFSILRFPPYRGTVVPYIISCQGTQTTHVWSRTSMRECRARPVRHTYTRAAGAVALCGSGRRILPALADGPASRHGAPRIWVRAPEIRLANWIRLLSRPGLWTASALGRSCARLRMVAFEDRRSFNIFVRWWLLKLIGRARATAARTGALAVLA